MIYIESDTNQIFETADKIIENVTDYEVLINNFFKKINDIPKTAEWTGQNAERYSDLTMLDKSQYLDFSNGIKDLAKEMQIFAETSENLVRKNQEDCESSKDARGY